MRLTDEDVDSAMLRFDKKIPLLYPSIKGYLFEMKKSLSMSSMAGCNRPVIIQPLMVNKKLDYYKGGVCFCVAKRNRTADPLATCGR